MSMSAATIDRRLAPERAKYEVRGSRGTRAGSLLKRQIPVRTWAQWDDAIPGFVEIDLVWHDGGNRGGGGGVPGSLAVATIVTCAIFATATGIIGACVTLMGLLAFPAMLKAGYSVRLSAGAVTAGGTLGILIPPSVLLILYGATAGVSVVQLYAGAFFPGLMLAGLYIVYVIIVAKLKPHLAPPLPMDQRHVDLQRFPRLFAVDDGRQQTWPLLKRDRCHRHWPSRFP